MTDIFIYFSSITENLILTVRFSFIFVENNIMKLHFIILTLLLPSLLFCQSIKKDVEKGEYFSNQRKFTEAIKCYTEAIDKDTLECSWLYYRRAILKRAVKDYSGAIFDFTNTINNDISCQFSYDKDNSTYTNAPLTLKTLYLDRGRLKSELSDYKGAKSDYDKVLELDPDIGEDFYLERGNIKFGIKDYKGAIDDYTISIKLHPTICPDEYWNRAFAKMQLNMTESACIDFSKAGEMGKKEAYEMIKKYCNQ